MISAGKSNKQGVSQPAPQGCRCKERVSPCTQNLIYYVLFCGKKNKVIKHFHGKLCIVVNVLINQNVILSPSTGRGLSLQCQSSLRRRDEWTAEVTD